MTVPTLPKITPRDEVWGRISIRVIVFLAASVLAGAIMGLVWFLTAPRPSYSISESLRASLPERELARVAGSDVFFVGLSALLGIVLGVLAWVWFHRDGLASVVMAVLGGTLAALVGWRMGLLVDGAGFAARLAAANPGDVVRMDLELRALAALVCAPFFAVLPVMIASAFLPEYPDEDGRARQAEAAAK